MKPRLPILNLHEAIKPRGVPGARTLFESASTRPILRSGPFRDRSEIWTIDPAVAPSDGIALQIANEIQLLRVRPRLVMIGSMVELFHPEPFSASDTNEILRVLDEHGIASWLITRGPIDVSTIDVLAGLRERPRITIGLATIDGPLSQMLEPWAATPAERIEFIAELKSEGLAVEVALDPLLPNLTDSRDKIQPLLEILATLKVERVTVGYLVLRHGVRDRVQEILDASGLATVVLGAYGDGPMLREGRELSQFLSKQKRQRGYAAIMAWASELGIEVRLGTLSNPDFRADPHVQTPHHIQSLQETFRRGTLFNKSRSA